MVFLLPPLLWWLQRAPGLMQADLALYDWAMSARKPAPSLDVLVVGIDERSLKALGPWPWPRSVHAQLLERLASQNPRAVLLNLFLDTPSASPAGDLRLAEAMTQLPVYLPLRYADAADTEKSGEQGFQEPLAEFARSARGLGHATLTPDQDGMTRRMFLHEGPRGATRPYVGWEMVRDFAGPVKQLDGPRAQAPFGVPFAGPAGTWRTVPYVSVLRGEVPPELLRDKLVLVGALANSKLGDEVSVSGTGPVTQLAGIELHANAIEALRYGRTVRFVDGTWLALWTALPVWLSLALFLRAARQSWAIALALGLICWALCLNLLWRQHVWLPPAAPLLGIALAYFLWSWRRLDALFRFFGQRVAVLNGVPTSAFEPERRMPTQAWDSVEAQTQALDYAIDRLTQMHSLLVEGLWQMPVALLICDDGGKITQSNAAARLLLTPESLSSPLVDDPLRGSTVRSILSRMQCKESPSQAEADGSTHWSDSLDLERMTAQGQVFRARAAPLTHPNGGVTNWMVVLRDLTNERRAEREREQWLSFMSHDIRTPQINILGLLDLHADGAHGVDQRSLTDGVRREVERSLALADGFVDLMQARLHTYRFAEVPAGAVVLDAVDHVWAHATAHGVSLSTRLEAEDAMLWADAPLLTRAIVNLLRNAIRHSAAGSAIELSVTVDSGAAPDRVLVSVLDQGEGMQRSQMEALLQPMASGASTDATHVPPVADARDLDDRETPPAAAPRSHGIGLVIVRTVVERHGGLLGGVSIPGAGTTFILDLPLHFPAEEADTSANASA